MDRPVRGFLLSFVVLAVPLGILAGAGVAVALRQLAHGREVAMARTLDAATAMVVDNQEALRREATLLAQDPALIDAAIKGDWATLVRWASPRIRALTRGGVVDLLVVRDARGMPLVQVPTVPPPLILNLPVPSEPAVTLRLVNGRAFFLATAPIWDSTAQDEASRLQVGTVVIARRFESLGRALDQVPARPGILLLAGDRALASTRPRAPVDGWSHAVSRGRAVLGAEVFALRLLGPEAPVSPDGSLWALVPETELYAARQRLWIWFAAALAVGAASLAVGVWVVTRGVAGGTASDKDARLYAETNRRLEETQALLEVAEILNSTLDPTRLLKQVAMKIALVCRVDRCSIERWDGDRVIPLMSQFADGRRDDHLWDAFIHMPSYPPRAVPAHARAIETRRPVIIPDATVTDLIPREWIETFGHKSFMAVPLIRQDAVIGLMTLDHTERVTPFEPWQVNLATAIAGQLALSIENARLYGEAQERLRETTSLLAVGQVLSRPAPAAEVMRRVAREVAHAFGADMVGVYVLDARKEALVPMAGYRVPKHLLEVFLKRPFVLSRFAPVAEEWTQGRAVWSSDVTSDPRFDPDTFEGMGPISVLFAPTPVRGESVGALFLVWWGGRREFQPAEVRLVEGVASQVGLAMENAELARQTLLKLQETENLHELSRAVTGQLDQAGLLETIHQQVARLLDVRHMIILLYDEASEELEVVMRVKDGVRLNGSARRYPRRAAGLSGIVLDTGRPIRTDDYTAECARRRVDPVPESVGLPHWLGVPMAAGDRIMGVLGLRSRDRAFTEGDQRLLASIADLAALALRSARLYEERTRAHRELAAAQDHLVRTEKLRALGEMASGVAHDFNNVLASILGRAQLLLGRVEDGKLRQWIEVIERSAMDGARTVRRLQEFTRIRRDQPVVPVDLNQVVQQTLETTESTWRQEFRSRGIEIDVATTLALPLPRVSGDPAELREAMTNLILNALDAMPQGGKLSLATSAADGRVEVRVSDTGVGIPAGIRQKIFDPFFTTKGPKGTGLGLSMTYGILARHNARITVESEEAHGTTFRMIFPAAPEHAETAGPPAAAPAAPVGSLRCLVVDDERAVAEVLGDMLVSMGHGATVVGSGQEAVTRFSAEPFDLVLTDLAMPGMTGWDVARAVKDAAPGVRVVLVSGFGVELSPEDLRAHGVDLVLAKPLKIEDIQAAFALIRPAAGAS